MKFERATEFTRVPPDLTMLLYKYVVLRLFPFHCYVQTESITAR
jgi:propanediol dehydratase small subunit